jgi:lactoylglutathione lyase
MISGTAKIHVHLHASDLARSRDFYERLFGAAPVKAKPGYLKFLPDFAPLNLALSARAPHEATSPANLSHLGIQLPSPEEVRRHLERVRAAGLDVRVEMDVDCCHANQDKFWATDPDGVEWELYFLRRDLESPTLPVLGGTSHAGDSSQAGATSGSAGACCSPSEKASA